jgi:hypothetical protein
MSASDGIYILQTDTDSGPEYRVKYCGAGIDDIYGRFNDETGKYEGDINKIESTFEDAPVFYNVNEAFDYAELMAQNYEYLEEGIALIRDFRSYGYLFEKPDLVDGKNQD